MPRRAKARRGQRGGDRQQRSSGTAFRNRRQSRTPCSAAQRPAAASAEGLDSSGADVGGRGGSERAKEGMGGGERSKPAARPPRAAFGWRGGLGGLPGRGLHGDRRSAPRSAVGDSQRCRVASVGEVTGRGARGTSGRQDGTCVGKGARGRERGRRSADEGLLLAFPATIEK